MIPNSILNYPKHSESLICFEEFGILLFYRSTKSLPVFVFNGKTTKYYTDGPNIKFKDWTLTLHSPPYFEQLNENDIPKQFNVPLILTKFTRRHET